MTAPDRPLARSIGVRLLVFATAAGLLWGLMPAASAQPPRPGQTGFFDHLLEEITRTIDGLASAIQENYDELERIIQDDEEFEREVTRQREERRERRERLERENAQLQEEWGLAQTQYGQLYDLAHPSQPLASQPSAEQPAPTADEPGPGLADDEIVALAERSESVRRGYEAVQDAQRRVTDAEEKKRKAQAANDQAQQNLDGVQSRSTGDWKTGRGDESSVERLQKRVEETQNAVNAADQELENAREVLGAKQAELDAIVEYEQAVASGADETTVGAAWRKAIDNASRVQEAGGTPAVLKDKGSTQPGQVATAGEQERRRQLRELAERRRDDINRDIAHEQGRRSDADNQLRQFRDKKQRISGNLSKRRGTKDAKSQSLSGKHQSDREAVDRKIETAKEKVQRHQRTIDRLGRNRDRLDRYIGALDNIEAKEKAVEAARGQGPEAERAAKEELAEAQQGLEEAAEDLGDEELEEEQADTAEGAGEGSAAEETGEGDERPRSSLQEAERTDDSRIAATGATVVQPGTGAVSAIGGLAWGSDDRDANPDQGEQEQQSQFTATARGAQDTRTPGPTGLPGEQGTGGSGPDIGRPGSTGDACTSIGVNATCRTSEGKQGSGVDQCDNDSMLAMCKGDERSGEVVITTPGLDTNPGPTGDACNSPSARATCEGKQAGGTVREAAQGGEVVWLSPEQMASGIVDQPDTTASPVLSGAVSGSQRTGGEPSGETRIRDLFPVTESQGGTQDDLLSPQGQQGTNPAGSSVVIPVAPGVGIGVGFNQQQQADTTLDLDDLGSGTSSTADPFMLPGFEQPSGSSLGEAFDQCGNLC